MAAAADPGAPVDLLEREAELEAIEHALQGARDGHGRLLVLEGGPGAGKSRLLAAARARARVAGMHVLAARGAELEREFPFGVALQLFARHLQATPPQRRAMLLSGPAGYAAPLFEAIGAADEQPAGERRAALMSGLCWLTANLAWESPDDERPLPLLLAIDDVQWSDGASLGFLTQLAGRLHELPVALVVCVRAGEPGPPEELLLRLRAQAGRDVLRPAPLSAAAVEHVLRVFLGRAPDPAFVRACAQATGGNAFLLTALVEQLRADQIMPTARFAARVERLVPEEVLRSTTLRLGRLSREAVRLARATAILGDRAPIVRVAAMAELEIEAAEHAADLLARARLLEVGEPLSFAHPLIAAAVIEEMGAMAVARAHRRAVEELSATGGDDQEIAGHLLLTRPAGDVRSVEILRSAAQAALTRGESAGAVRLLRRALEEPPADEARPGVLLELARAEAANGEPGATDRLDQVLAIITDPSARADAMLTLCRLLSARGDYARAARVAQRGLSELGPDDSLRASLEEAYLAAAMFDPATRPGAIAQLEPLRRRAWAGRLPDQPALSAQLAVREATAGGAPERVRLLAEAALAGDPLVDPSSHGRTAGFAVAALLHVDELDRAETALAAALEAARAKGLLVAVGAMRRWRALAHYRRGRLHDAISDGEAALEIARTGWASYEGWSAAILAHARIEVGELDCAREAVSLGEAAPPGLMDRALVLEARGRLALLDGDPASALRDFEAAGRHLADGFGLWHPGIFSWRRAAAVAAHQLGRAEEARNHVRIAEQEARRARVARPIGEALRVAGMIAGGEEGIALLRQAVAVLERSPSQLEFARALVDLGGALRRHSERAAARPPLRRGFELADRFGARPLADTALSELRATGARPRRAALSGRDALTPTERRIAEQAAAGRANPQIANALFVTTKTVEWHLSHVYRKLDITTREQLAAALLKENPGGSAR